MNKINIYSMNFLEQTLTYFSIKIKAKNINLMADSFYILCNNRKKIMITG